MRRLVLTGVLVALGGCGDDAVGPGAPDLLPAVDLRAPESDLASPDLSQPEQPDLAEPDLAPEGDLAMPDLLTPDLATCTEGAFLGCSAGKALFCGTGGTSVNEIDCGAGGCQGTTGCGQCVGGTSSCAGAQLASCDAYERVTESTCVLGCVEDTPIDADAGTGAAHCQNLVPSNGLVADCAKRSATFSIELTANATIDPEAGTFNGQVVPTGVYNKIPSDGVEPAIGVFHLSTLSVPAGFTLQVTCPAAQNDPANQTALALVVDGDVLVAGKIDNAAHLGASGSTAGCGSTYQLGDASDPIGAIGGGGGAFGGAGGNGGGATVVFGTGSPAYPDPDDPRLIPLQGGGGGRYSTNTKGAGGGGAVQIVACGSITVGGTINVGGGGAPQQGATSSGGLAGGAGGGILLEAASVNVSGVLAANGGGGGGGAVGGTNGGLGVAGGDAAVDDQCGAGGGGNGATGGGATGGQGGAGACGADPDGFPGTVGSSVTGSPATHGGGGGGGGRIRINVLTGTPTVGAHSVTPDPLYTSGTLSKQ